MKIMTRISCEVTKCMYNANGGCKLEEIRVGTSAAKISDQTKCESYTPEGSSHTNSCGCKNDACNISSISCSAKMCKYNENGICEADKIKISNCKDCKCGETECVTFKAE